MAGPAVASVDKLAQMETDDPVEVEGIVTTKRTRRVVVFGSSRCPEGGDDHRRAVEVGTILGRHGLEVVTGGYQGSMGAVSRGAKEAGGRVVGITTAIFADRVPNPWLDERIDEPDYPTRMARLLREGDAYLALPGGLGTLSEWLAAWCLASIGQLGGPLWAFADPWRPIHERVVALPEVGPERAAGVEWVEGPEDFHWKLERWLSGK